MVDSKDNIIEARLLALEQTVARLSGNPGNPGHMSKVDAITIREYFDSRLEAVEKATNLSSATLDKRLDGMNEFRNTLKDQASRFITRDELSAQIKIINVSLKELRTFKDQMEGKASASSVYLAWGLSVVGLIIGIVGLFI